MDYFVMGQDGKEYGPANIDTLRQWAEQSRLLPQTMLKAVQTGALVPASSVPGIFPAPAPVASPVAAASIAPPVSQVPPGNWSQPPAPSPYPRQGSVGPQSDGGAELFGAIFRSVLALALFFFFHGIGLAVAGYGVYYGIQAKSKGHRYGTIALVVPVVTFVVLLIGWAFRMSGKSV